LFTAILNTSYETLSLLPSMGLGLIFSHSKLDLYIISKEQKSNATCK